MKWHQKLKVLFEIIAYGFRYLFLMFMEPRLYNYHLATKNDPNAEASIFNKIKVIIILNIELLKT